jgi:hypothetical protein
MTNWAILSAVQTTTPMTASQLFLADALATQFAVDMNMTKQQAISARILILQNKGTPGHKQAFDKLCTWRRSL